jgi:DHA2 family methylenomycin A resistance protein-like MFS transporter
MSSGVRIALATATVLLLMAAGLGYLVKPKASTD